MDCHHQHQQLPMNHEQILPFQVQLYKKKRTHHVRPAQENESRCPIGFPPSPKKELLSTQLPTSRSPWSPQSSPSSPQLSPSSPPSSRRPDSELQPLAQEKSIIIIFFEQHYHCHQSSNHHHHNDHHNHYLIMRRILGPCLTQEKSRDIAVPM